MTTVALIDQSVEDAEVVDFYDISVGTQLFRLTSNNVDLTYLGNLYLATPITRTSPKVSADSVEAFIETTLPQSHPLAQLYYGVPPGQKVWLKVRRTHKSILATATPDFAFVGYLSSWKFGGEISITFRWDQPSTFFNRTAPRYVYSTLCNHILGDLRCQVDLELFKFVGTVTTMPSEDTITVPGASARGADYFDAGIVMYSSTQGPDYRLIMQQTGDNMRLQAPFRDNVVGSVVSLYAGCKHRAVQDCKNKFNNLPRFGGFPHIPWKNPFEIRIV